MARNSNDKTEIQVYTVNAKNGLNLRNAPSGAILAVLAHGAKVTMLDEAEGWTNVKTKSGSGWVMSKYLERKK